MCDNRVLGIVCVDCNRARTDWISLHNGRDGGQDGYEVSEKRWTVQYYAAQQRDGRNQTGAECCAG